jgi:hypothetical protein
MANKSTGSKGVPDNERATPFTYQVIHRPSLLQQRAALAMEAENMSADELKAAAADAGIDTSGAGTQAELVDRVRNVTRGDGLA